MKIFFKIFFLLLVIIAVYAAATSYIRVRKGMSAIITDKLSGNVVYTAEEGHRFILYNAFWWKYSIETVSLRNFWSESIRIDIPALKELKNEAFAVIIPVKVDFSVNPVELYDLNLLKNATEGVKKAIENELKAGLNFSIMDYLSPVYMGDVIRKERDAILERLKKSVPAAFAGKGITIHGLDYMDAISFPDNRRYAEGINHLESLHKMFFENDRKLIELKKQLERDSMSLEALYNRYREMSLIIGKNPDILKYIYIDKMAPNLRLMILSDKSAFPAFLDENDKKTETHINIETEAAPKNESVNAE